MEKVVIILIFVQSKKRNRSRKWKNLNPPMFADRIETSQTLADNAVGTDEDNGQLGLGSSF